MNRILSLTSRGRATRNSASNAASAFQVRPHRLLGGDRHFGAGHGQALPMPPDTAGRLPSIRLKTTATAIIGIGCDAARIHRALRRLRLPAYGQQALACLCSHAGPAIIKKFQQMAGANGRSVGPRAKAGSTREGARCPRKHTLTGPDVGPPAFLQAVWTGEIEAIVAQVRAETAALPFEHNNLGEDAKANARKLATDAGWREMCHPNEPWGLGQA
jgi:hypothetical protein